ncbi:MAG: LysR family transcriptional regulator [Bdellovibrionaceae bacterium]|nr:LysR family transcriptional regulator [Pseudobdellovibrionaceae bacterium]
MINYNHIYYFYEVARFNSITKAAQHLRLSQPSLSIQIKTLEQQLGFKLIEKKGRNIVLTEWGQRLYAQTARLFQGTSDLVSRFKEKDHAKNLRLVVPISVEPSFLLEMVYLTEKKRNSKLKIELNRLTSWSEKDDEILSNADLLISDQRVSQFRNWSLFEEISMPVNLFQSQVHKVNENNIILPGKKTILRDETEDYLSSLPKNGYRPAVESDFISSIVRSVIEGYGVAFLPVQYMQEPMEQGLVTRSGPKRGFWQHSLYIYWKNQEEWSTWLNAFSKNIQQ